MFIVGIDIAKRSHMVRVVDSDGQTVYKPFPIRNNCSGCNTLLERLRKLTNQKSDFVVAMESTAHYWLALYTRLRKGSREAGALLILSGKHSWRQTSASFCHWIGYMKTAVLKLMISKPPFSIYRGRGYQRPLPSKVKRIFFSRSLSSSSNSAQTVGRLCHTTPSIHHRDVQHSGTPGQ